MNIFKKIFSIYNENSHKVICILGFKIKKRNYKLEIKLLNDKIEKLKDNLNKKLKEVEHKNSFRLKKLLPVNSINTIEMHIIDFCNLNCRSCHHFAPLAPKDSMLTLEEFERDLTRLYELTKGDVETFNILGGEPLLHPQCIEFYETARRIFPNSNIKLITNGVLLPTMPDSFYERCGKNNILIQPTDYHLDIDYETVKEKCKQFGVNFKFYLDNSEMDKDVIDLSGSNEPLYSYLNCRLGWSKCFYLDHGKIYHCSKEAYMRFFSNYFKLDIKIPETDYIDIYKVNNIQEIFNFMITPPKFCSHCQKGKKLIKHKREASKKDISEWT